jgi:hypothetical protein
MRGTFEVSASTLFATGYAQHLARIATIDADTRLTAVSVKTR